MERITVVCIKQGTKYSSEYANNLYRAVRQYTTVPYQFVCVTDDTTGIECPAVPLEGGLTGWWSKLSLFRKAAYGLHGVILYFDLDTILLDNVDALLTHDSDFCILRDFTRPEKYGSGVFRLRVGSQPRVWSDFNSEHMERIGIYGDQEWIWEKIQCADLWPKSWCVSFKEHCQNGPPQGAKVVCFHGEPKPHNCGVPWVQDAWSPIPGETLKDMSLGPASTQETSFKQPSSLKTHIFGGQIRYHCPDCGFDSYAIELVWRHWQGTHKQASSPVPTLFDAKGTEIKRPDIQVPESLREFNESLRRV